MRTNPLRRTWIACLAAIPVVLFVVWFLGGDPAPRGRRSARSAEVDAGELTTTQPDRHPSPEGAGEPAPGRPPEGEVRGEVVVPPSSGVQPKLRVKPTDGQILAERPARGDFRLSYERVPERSYLLEVDAPGMRPVSVPLPAAVEDVGKIVLQPCLGYRGRLVLDGKAVAGTSVTLHGREGIQFGRSVAASDAEGRFEIRVTDTDFSTLTGKDGAYSALSLAFTHATLSFHPVAARVEGFWGEHVVELSARPGAEFVLSSGAGDVPIRLERSFDRSRETRASRDASVVTPGRTSKGGHYRTPWPVGWNAAWVVVGAAPEEIRYLVTTADLQAAEGPITLIATRTHRFQLRASIQRAPMPNAEVTILVRWKGPPVAAGFLRGATDAAGNLGFRLGATDARNAGPVEIVTASVLYAHGGSPRSETFDLVRRNRGHQSTRRLDLKLGKDLDEAGFLWFTCKDDAGHALTPTRIWCLARLEGGLDPIIGTGLRAVPASMGGPAGLFRVGGLVLPAEGSRARAKGAVFLVDTVEQGQERFPMSRDQWDRAKSAGSPLPFRFARKETEELEFLVVDHARVPVPRAWVTIVPLDLRPNLRGLEQTRASADRDGVVKAGYLSPDREYQVFVYDARDGRTGFVARFEPKNAPRTTVVVLEPVTTFESAIRLDAGVFPDTKCVGAYLASDPQGILPMVPCVIRDGRITAQRPSGLAGYQLRISTYHAMLGLVGVTRAAKEAHGATVSFPD